MAIDFLIVGGGIGGAVLARRLGEQGKRVLLLEKDRDRPPSVRPEVLWPATVDRLRTLGTGNDLEAAMLPLRGVVFARKGEILGGITPEVLRSIDLVPMSTDPARTRGHLLCSGPFELRRGVEVVAILKDGDRVVGVRGRDIESGEECEELASWTVGDDGVHSPVREGCGITLKARLFPMDFLCFGFDWPADLPEGEARFWFNPGQARSGILGLAAIPLPGGRGAGLVPARPRIFDVPSRADEGWRSFAAGAPMIATLLADRAFPGSLARIRRPWGHAARYGTSGAVLMGDAAHPVSPAGGQGANMAIADAMALADLVADGVPDLVAAYERRRRPANRRSISITRRGAWAFSMPPFLLDLLFPRLLGAIGRRPESIRRALAFASTAYLG